MRTNVKRQESRDQVLLRNAYITESETIYEVLIAAFSPFGKYYTEEARKATVMSPCEIEERIRDDKHEVLVATSNNEIVGTVTLQMRDEGDIYVRSMAVSPYHQGKSIGRRLLEELERRAQQKGVKTISLECSEPLKRAIHVYESFGFTITGKKRVYHGVKMKKEV
jgi:ribosomal protein S18 acetylase RimI-like enzyme